MVARDPSLFSFLAVLKSLFSTFKKEKKPQDGTGELRRLKGTSRGVQINLQLKAGPSSILDRAEQDLDHVSFKDFLCELCTICVVPKAKL